MLGFNSATAAPQQLRTRAKAEHPQTDISLYYLLVTSAVNLL